MERAEALAALVSTARVYLVHRSRTPSVMPTPTLLGMRSLVLLLVALPVAMILPHLPGRFDASASTLSFVAQAGSYASVAFVPIGIAWLTPISQTRTIAAATSLAGGLALSVVVLSAAAVNQLALGLLVAAVGTGLLRRLHSHASGTRSSARTSRRRFGAALLALPTLLILFAQLALPAAAEWSRDRAIQHSAVLVDAIETFYQRRGHYPLSLQSLNRDVPTGVVGVERFEYEPSGDAYNVFFIRQAVALDASEVVLYNRLGEHRFASHELDILQYDGDELDRRRGDRRRTPLRQPGWISILFD